MRTISFALNEIEIEVLGQKIRKKKPLQRNLRTECSLYQKHTKNYSIDFSISICEQPSIQTTKISILERRMPQQYNFNLILPYLVAQ